MKSNSELTNEAVKRSGSSKDEFSLVHCIHSSKKFLRVLDMTQFNRRLCMTSSVPPRSRKCRRRLRRRTWRMTRWLLGRRCYEPNPTRRSAPPHLHRKTWHNVLTRVYTYWPRTLLQSQDLRHELRTKAKTKANVLYPRDVSRTTPSIR